MLSNTLDSSAVPPNQEVLITSVLVALASNVLFLLGMVTCYDMVLARTQFSSPRSRAVCLGLLLGLIAVLVRMATFGLAGDISINSQPVVLGLAGLFGGFVPAAIAVGISALHRISLGGPALAAGLIVIVASAAVGLLWRRLRKDQLHALKAWEFLVLGGVILLVTLVAGVLLPTPLRSDTFSLDNLAVIPIFPLATALAGIMLADRLRRTTETADLMEAEARAQLAATAGHHGVFDLDLLTGKTTVNPEYSRLLGYEPSTFEPSQAAWLERIHPEDRARVAAAFQECAAGVQRETRAEYRMRTAGGGFIWVSSVVSALGEGPTGAPTRIVGTHTDITSWRELQSMQRLQLAALEATADAVVVTDLEGTIEWCNPAFTTVTGFSSEEALGKNPRDLLKSGSHDATFYAEMWQTLLSGEIWSGELINRRANGATYIEFQTITPVREADGRITHFVAIKRDITARRQLEMQFHQAQKMETIGRLAGTVAHDFNNLLTVIVSSLDLARTGVSLSDPVRAELVEAQRAAERGAALTRQLLGFSRLKPINQEELDLAEIVRDLTPMFLRLIGDNIRVELHLPPALPTIRGDSGQLGQVLLNLVVNARDAMPSGGLLTITGASITETDGTVVEIRVADSGVGITPELVSKIFDPFFTTKPPGEGTGLGLSTVRGIVEEANGTIHVDSVSGAGTTFTLSFPATDALVVHPTRATTAHTPPYGQPVTPSDSAMILLVEDEETIRRVARRVLEREGHRVLEADSGDGALEAIAEHGSAIGLVITDLVMPGMSGADFLAELRVQLPSTPIILMSGYTAEAARARAEAEDDIYFLGKPFGVSELQDIVRAALGGSAQPHASA